MRVKTIKYKIIALLLVISIFFLRPMFLGYGFTYIGLILLSLIYLRFLFAKNFKKKEIDNSSKKIYFLVLKLYLPVQVMLFLTWEIEHALGELIIIFSTAFFLKEIFLLENITKNVFWMLKMFFLLIIISSVITSLYYFTTYYYNIDKLEVTSIEVRSREETGNFVKIFFPLSPLYSFFTTTDIVLPRFNIFFMEAGMASSFLSSIAYITIQKKTFLNHLTYLIFFVGGILTFSTSFLPSFILPIIVMYLINKKGEIKLNKFVLVSVFLIIGFYLFLKIPHVGYEAKNTDNMHSSSFQDRLTWFSFSVENLTRYIRTFAALFLVYLIGKLKKNKRLFYCYMIPIIFTGIINVVFFTPLFLLFCFFNFEYLENRKTET